jgi:hypothetical protein
MILCDTDIMIEFYKDNSQIIQELRYIKRTAEGFDSEIIEAVSFVPFCTGKA